jgi:hypothetical protein
MLSRLAEELGEFIGEATGFVFPDRKAWPIGDKKHAKIAITYMAAGRGDPEDYSEIIKAIQKKYKKDADVIAMLDKEMGAIKKRM